MQLLFRTLLVLFASSGVAQGSSLIRDPVSATLERVSLGPTVGLGGVLTREGPGAVVTLGVGVSVFDHWIVPDPACEERRRREREALGGDRVKIWGDVLNQVQQRCRAIEEAWFPSYDGGLELGLGVGAARGGHLRGSFAPLSWRHFMLGASVSGVLTQDAEDDTVIGLRIGPELSAHFRWDRESWRPVASVFLRGEATAVRRDHVPDQLVLGARFLVDL